MCARLSGPNSRTSHRGRGVPSEACLGACTIGWPMRQGILSRVEGQVSKLQILEGFGGPGEIRTHDLFHAMEARSQLRHRPTRDGLPSILAQAVYTGRREQFVRQGGGHRRTDRLR